MNIAAILDRRAQVHPERVALTEADGRVFSYRELSERASRCAAALKARGMAAGMTVGYLGVNSVAEFDVMLACARLGAIFVPLNFRLSAPEIARVLADAKPACVFVDESFAALLADSQFAREAILSTSESLSLTAPGANFAVGEGVRSDGETFALIYTSGSTGAPKGVRQTHRNAFFRALASIVDFQMTSADVVLVAAPLFHVAGLNALTLSAVHVGARIVVQPRFDPARTLELLTAESITCFAAAPTMLKMLTSAPNFAPEQLRGLRFVLVGGEPLESAVQEQWRSFGVELLNVFGMSETADGVLYQRIGERTPANCIGKPAAYVDVKLEPDALAGGAGELWIGGPTVSPGYWGDPERSRGVFKNGWVNTGDLASRDASGDYFILGRADNMIKSGAEKIAPAELENAIAMLPQVAEVVVFGVPHPKWGQAARAVIAVRPGAHLTQQEVLEHCTRVLAAYKKPQSIVLLEQLPRTGSGKVDRAQIRALYGAPEQNTQTKGGEI